MESQKVNSPLSLPDERMRLRTIFGRLFWADCLKAVMIQGHFVQRTDDREPNTPFAHDQKRPT